MKKTAEFVSPKHPDKICDFIADSILDAYLKKDKESRTAIELMGGHNLIIINGEVTSKGNPDIEKLVKLAYDKCQPKIINIPTNGILWTVIPKKAEMIAKSCPKSEVVINLSLDQVGEKHEQIRQIKGNWGFSMKTWQGLKDAQKRCPNLTLGIHSVVSNFNVDDFKNVYDGLNKLTPDSYITEIAEERVELDTIGTGITPSYDKYSKAIDYVMDQMKKRSPKGVARMAWAFRLQYYQIVKKWVHDKKSLGDKLPEGRHRFGNW